MKMKKRVDRNQKIYEYVNNEIRKKAQANSNVEFKNTNETLKSINPALFGNSTNVNQENNIKLKSNNKNLLISSIVFSIIVILIIAVAVVIYYATK